MKKKYKDELDEIFEDMNSYTGEKLREDELFDRVLDFLTSHNTELISKIEGLKKDNVFVPDHRDTMYGGMICRSCGAQEDCDCATYNQALNEVISLIKE